MRLSCSGDDSEAEVLYVNGKEEGCNMYVCSIYQKSTIGGEMISLGYFKSALGRNKLALLEDTIYRVIDVSWKANSRWK
jgi:hypothetical protein